MWLKLADQTANFVMCKLTASKELMKKLLRKTNKIQCTHHAYGLDN